MTADPTPQRRVELILHQLTGLPTLSPIAIRLLQLTSDDESEIAEIVRLIESDPSLSVKVLKLCQRHARGRANNVETVERAVLLLGIQDVRSAILSVQVFDVFDDPSSGDKASGGFDRASFWHHSLAVAIVSEELARLGCFGGTTSPGEAFLAGLLHDLGMLSLHVMLPESLDRICRLAETRSVSLDAASRRFIGLDTHTIGKRLAEHWSLPRPLADAMWLHGQPYELIPDLPHRDLIGVVGLADAVARSAYVTPSGHGPNGANLDSLCAEAGIDRSTVQTIVESLADRVRDRASILGLDDANDTDILVRALIRANAALARINERIQVRAKRSDRQTQLLHAIDEFHRDPSLDSSVVDVWSRLVCSAVTLFGGTFFAGVYRLAPDDVWQLVQLAPDGRVVGHRILESEADVHLERLSSKAQRLVPLAIDLEQFGFSPPIDGDGHDLRALGLDCGWGVSALVLVETTDDFLIPAEDLDPVIETWSAALAAAAQHQSSRRLSEQLAEANQTLLHTQHELARKETMAAVGEIAAGAAHEMNNPLTVIAGRSQLLVRRLEDPDHRKAAEQIVEQSHRLSDLITALRRFAAPASPSIERVDPEAMVRRAVETARRGLDPDLPLVVEVHVPDGVPSVAMDGGQMAGALAELVRNSIEAEGTHRIVVEVQIDASNGRLTFQITDDGSGLSDHALIHAFDPFFSAKPAGRQPGLGLAEARRIVEAHGGRLSLVNGPSTGAIATVWLPLELSVREVA